MARLDRFAAWAGLRFGELAGLKVGTNLAGRPHHDVEELVERLDRARAAAVVARCGPSVAPTSLNSAGTAADARR